MYRRQVRQSSAPAISSDGPVKLVDAGKFEGGFLVHTKIQGALELIHKKKKTMTCFRGVDPAGINIEEAERHPAVLVTGLPLHEALLSLGLDPYDRFTLAKYGFAVEDSTSPKGRAEVNALNSGWLAAWCKQQAALPPLDVSQAAN